MQHLYATIARKMSSLAKGVLGGEAAQPAIAISAPSRPEPAPSEAVNIPINDHGAEELASDTACERGRFLVRQDRWSDLADEMRAAESGRETTPGGMPVADLLAFGARSDVINAVEHALDSGASRDEPVLLNGIMEFEAALHEHRDDPMVALVVALAHIDIAWAWRGQDWPAETRPRHRKRAAAHFDRAAKILDRFCGLSEQSPALLAACCALHAGRQSETLAIADSYAALIDLAPENPRHMRALGNHMLPRWFGNLGALELEARRTAARTQLFWGAGGYSWVYFDAIAQDEQALAQVDVDYFLDGLRDIVRVRPDQEMINLLTAFCAVAMQCGPGRDTQADANRARISAAAQWLIRDHLTEIRPMIWAHAADGFANNLRIPSARQFASRGQADALDFLSNIFHDEITRGQRITFTPAGLRLDNA